MAIRGRAAWSVAAFVLATAWAAAAQSEIPLKVASNARLDVVVDKKAGTLDSGSIVAGRGTIERRNWVGEEEKDRGYTVQFPVTRLGWRALTIQMMPAHDGQLTISLMGPYEVASPGQIYRQELDWDGVKITGATISGGDFETDAAGWRGLERARVAGSSELPAFEGKSFARTWHNEPVVAEIAVKGGALVTIELHARATTPAGYQEMPRILDRNSPAFRALAHFRHGANLGNGLEVPPGQTWGEHYTPADIKHIGEEGFDHIRIPIGWHHYTGPGPEFRIEPDFFARVDELVTAGLRQKLGVLINIHHFDDFTTDPAKQRDKFVAIWSQIAAHYAKAPGTLAFELLNEPKDAATTAVMNDVIPIALAAIRKIDPGRTVFVGPGRWNSISELPSLRLPADDNLIVTVHNYDPFYFTHQGATWAGDDVKALSGVHFPGPPATPLVIDEKQKPGRGVLAWVQAYNTQPAARNPCGPMAFEGLFEQAKEWSEYYGRPIHLGEFGAFTAADPQSRANYYRAAREAAEKAGFGWAIWDWKAGFRYWNAQEGHAEPGLKDALLGPTTRP